MLIADCLKSVIWWTFLNMLDLCEWKSFSSYNCFSFTLTHLLLIILVIFLRRLFWVDLISGSQMSVHMHVHPQSFFDLNEMWLVGRGRRVMHDGMQYDPIRGQGHEPLKVGNHTIFNSYLFCHVQLELATDHWFLN